MKDLLSRPPPDQVPVWQNRFYGTDFPYKRLFTPPKVEKRVNECSPLLQMMSEPASDALWPLVLLFSKMAFNMQFI